MCSYIPSRGEQMVCYYGYNSDVTSGKTKKNGTDDAIPCIFETKGNSKTFGKNWARLIQMIYEVAPRSARDIRELCESSVLLKMRRLFMTSSHIRGPGMSGQGRFRKSMICQAVNTPLLTSKSNHTLTLSTETQEYTWGKLYSDITHLVKKMGKRTV